MKRIVAALSLALALAAGAAGPPRCELSQIAVWPVRLQGGLPVVEGSINGQKAGIMLDTGAYASMITKDAAQRMDLYTRATGEIAAGVGGESRVLMTRVRELRIADATAENMRVRVIGERPIRGVDFILGDDFFRAVDLEFDYAKGVVRVYKPSAGCKDAWLAYWDPRAMRVPFEEAHRILIPVKVNGREATAMLDSGAASSTVSLGLAEKLGITPKTAGVMPASCAAGLGADAVRAWVAPFDTLSIGDETIRDARLRVIDMSDLAYGREAADLLLGTDFLRAHRLFVSRHQGKVYFSYAGGQVFPNTPELDCDDRLAGRNSNEALAAYDRALAQDPRDVKALLGRSLVRWRMKDLAGALADLDAVIAMEPGNGVALRQRMAVRRASGDYDGALADADAALANGMRSADLYVGRATLRTAKGDWAGALEESAKALELDPRHSAALRLHGRSLFNAGRFEAAEADFEARLAVQRSPYDALWIFLSRARRGVDGTPVLEQWLAKSKEGDWPEPVMAYLLGRIDRERLLATAAADPAKRAGRECEARFYLAEGLIASGHPQEARPFLEQARDECPRERFEYEAAKMESPAK